tara:strand:- start:1162 stop:1266 length:105 start_codon:yes stop_codon:yes gene_type:complete
MDEFLLHLLTFLIQNAHKKLEEKSGLDGIKFYIF